MTLLSTIRDVVSDVLPELFNEPATLYVFTEGSRSAAPTYTEYTLTKACFRDSRQLELRGVGVIRADENAVAFYRKRLPSGVDLKPNDEVKLTDPIDSSQERFKLVRLADEDPARALQTWACVEVANA